MSSLCLKYGEKVLAVTSHSEISVNLALHGPFREINSPKSIAIIGPEDLSSKGPRSARRNSTSATLTVFSLGISGLFVFDIVEGGLFRWIADGQCVAISWVCTSYVPVPLLRGRSRDVHLLVHIPELEKKVGIDAVI